MSAQGCGQLDDVMAELALGLLDGAERADALAHIERCGQCQAEVASLTGVAEQLLLLAPELPPPAGFETRVLDRIEPSPGSAQVLKPVRSPASSPRRWWPRRTLLVASAAAAVVVVIGALVTMLASLGDGDPKVTTAEMLSARGRVVGEAALHHTEPAVVELDIAQWVADVKAAGAWPGGNWSMAIESADGERTSYPVQVAERLVELELDGSQPGSRAVDANDVVSVSVVDETGRVWCEGRFPD